MFITFDKLKKELEKSGFINSLSKIKNKFLIFSGKGGVGKSTVAANLALSKALKGYKVGLLDVDLHGPSLGSLFNVPPKIEVSASGQLLPTTIMENLKLLTIQSFLKNHDDAIIWRGPKKRAAIKQFISDVLWGDLDFLFIDAPPGTGDETLVVLETIKDIKPIIVSNGHKSSIDDVKKAINFLKELKISIFALIDNQSRLICHNCKMEINLYNPTAVKNLAKEFNIKFLESFPMYAEVAAASESGKPIVWADENHPYSKLMFNLAF